ncbi:hypothetical protein [Streptomyces pini]|uniref:Uncharacterized protein n=1 Tax=Streptomyces pini TaxID=1520580 RepID=A0A1I4C4B4_9ACTN|nr:hypothetical protein [Streptomyces pini]SFK75159.1 hypothetical protein SAMN05192584_108228 [Streptomyces pini]
MSVQPTHSPPAGASARTNAVAVEVTRDYLNLPALAVKARPDAVHVTVADVCDLSRWMFALGGRAHTGPVDDGAVLVTLRTATPDRPGGAVPIVVHAVAVEGEDVLADVHSGAVLA